jgi:hypothetical protein
LVAVPLVTLCWWIAAAPAEAQAPPPNDNYLSSTIIPQAMTTSFQQVMYTDTQDTTSATTQPDLFNPERSGLPFGGGGPEPVTCHGVTYGNTIWYDMHPKIPVSVELNASGFLNVIAVYEWSLQTSKITREIGCQVSASATQTNDFIFPVELQKGHVYTVQIGGVQTPAGVAAGPLTFSATFFPDHDGDGVLDPLDACPTLAGPLLPNGAPQFGGCPPTLRPTVSYSYLGPTASALSITKFELTSIPGRARLQARCSCGVQQTIEDGAHANSVTLTSFVGARIPLGSTIEIWATKRATGRGIYKYGAIGAYRKYTVSSSGLGTPIKRCLMPGSMTPRLQCPPGGRKQL